eukprot:jgi/Psemu1/46346/gm1.46346_g
MVAAMAATVVVVRDIAATEPAATVSTVPIHSSSGSSGVAMSVAFGNCISSNSDGSGFRFCPLGTGDTLSLSPLPPPPPPPEAKPLTTIPPPPTTTTTTSAVLDETEPQPKHGEETGHEPQQQQQQQLNSPAPRIAADNTTEQTAASYPLPSAAATGSTLRTTTATTVALSPAREEEEEEDPRTPPPFESSSSATPTPTLSLSTATSTTTTTTTTKTSTGNPRSILRHNATPWGGGHRSRPSTGRRVGGLWSTRNPPVVPSLPSSPRAVRCGSDLDLGFDLDRLRGDTLARILEYLPLSDLLRAGTVCRRWRHEVYHPYRYNCNYNYHWGGAAAGRSSNSSSYHNDSRLWDTVDATSFLHETYERCLAIATKQQQRGAPQPQPQKQKQNPRRRSRPHRKNHNHSTSEKNKPAACSSTTTCDNDDDDDDDDDDPSELWARIRTGIALGTALQKAPVPIRSLVLRNVGSQLSEDRLDDFVPPTVLAGLESLTLTGFPGLTHTHLHVLLLAGSNSNSGASHLDPRGRRRGRGWTHLVLEDCPRVSNEAALRSIARICPGLRTLSLNGCSYEYDHGRRSRHRVLAPSGPSLSGTAGTTTTAASSSSSSSSYTRMPSLAAAALFLPPSNHSNHNFNPASTVSKATDVTPQTTTAGTLTCSPHRSPVFDTSSSPSTTATTTTTRTATINAATVTTTNPGLSSAASSLACLFAPLAPPPPNVSSPPLATTAAMAATTTTTTTRETTKAATVMATNPGLPTAASSLACLFAPLAGTTTQR